MTEMKKKDETTSENAPAVLRPKQQTLKLSWQDKTPAATAAAEEKIQPATTAITAPDLPPRNQENDAGKTADGKTEVSIIKLTNMDLSFGQTLLEARGACNFSIAQVHQQTRVPKEFIETVENEEIERLPPPLYTRSHIKKLCLLYGIDGEKVVKDFNRRLQENVADQDSGAAKRLVISGAGSDKQEKVCYRLDISETLEGQTFGSKLTKILISIASVIFLALVVSAIVLQHLRNRRADTTTDQAVITQDHTQGGAAAEVPDLKQFIIPQQLPLKELQIPQH